MLWSQIVDRASIPFEPSDEIKQKAKKYGEEAQQDFAFHTKSYERTRVGPRKLMLLLGY